MSEDTGPPATMAQVAPWPAELADLVDRLRYPESAAGRLEPRLVVMGRGQGCHGLTLEILRVGPDSYHPQDELRVSHRFPVPPAAYWRGDWQRWLFDRLADVERHELMENFALLPEGATAGGAGDDAESWERPYRPVHAPGWDPYVLHDPTTEQARRTSFRGVLDDDGTGRPRA